MARVGGRNAVVAWVIGVGCAAAVGALAVLALPMLAVSASWLGGAAKAPSSSSITASTDATPHPSASASASASGGAVPTGCDELYDEALRADLDVATGSQLTRSADAPETSATALVSALQPRVVFTCDWRSDRGMVSTTLAHVPTDAGALAASALPHAGFTCTAQGEHARCSRTDGDLTETIEAGGGLWLSTSERGWHPGSYASRTAARVWSR